MSETRMGNVEQGLSQMERVVDTFVAPSKTFADILRSTSWWLPFVLATVMSVVVTVGIDRQVGFDRVVENMIHSSPKQEEALANLTPEQRAGRLHGMALGYRYTSYASPVFILAISAVGALVMWGSFNFGLGAQTTFGQMFCLWMYCSLPRLLTGVLTLVMVYFGGNVEGFDFKDPVGTNVGFYLGDAAPWLKAGLGFLDVIGLWVVVLMVLGTATVAKVSRGKAAAVVLGWWGVMLVLSMVGASFS